MLIGQRQTGGVGGATRLRKLWEQEEQRRDPRNATEKPADAEDNYAALRKGTKLHAEQDKNHGLD